MKFDTKKTVYIGFAFLSITAFWQIYDNIIPLILKNSFHIGDTLSGIVMALDNVLALFLLPYFGSLSDKIDTKIGRRMPFIIIGTVGSVICMIFIPIASNIGSLALFFVSLFLVLLFMGIYRSPSVALMPDATPKVYRSKANAIINLMGAVGGMISLILISLLVSDSLNPDYLPLFASVAALMVLSLGVLLLKVRENEFRKEREKFDEAFDEEDEEIKEEKNTSSPMDPEVKKSLYFILMSVALWYMAYNGVVTSFSKYAQTYWHMKGGGFANALMVATISAILSYIPSGALATKIGRKKTIIIGVVILMSMYIIGAFYKSYSFSINIVFALVGVSWAVINVNSYPMVVEMSKGNDIGKFTGMYYTFSMAAQIITPIISGAFLEYVGYWTLFPYAGVFSFLALLTMLKVKHGDSKPLPPKSKLEAFDFDD